LQHGNNLPANDARRDDSRCGTRTPDPAVNNRSAHLDDVPIGLTILLALRAARARFMDSINLGARGVNLNAPEYLESCALPCRPINRWRFTFVIHLLP
jgi:hypothetical protein